MVKDYEIYLQRLPVFPFLELPFFYMLGFRGLYLLPALAGRSAAHSRSCL